MPFSSVLTSASTSSGGTGVSVASGPISAVERGAATGAHEHLVAAGFEKARQIGAGGAVGAEDQGCHVLSFARGPGAVATPVDLKPACHMLALFMPEEVPRWPCCRPAPMPTTGARGIAAWFLTLCRGRCRFVPGLIHYFLPDGGAGVIAGMDLSSRRQTIITMFAWFGALQIPYALAQIAMSLRYRPLVPFFLALIVLERGLMAFDGWFGKGAGGHHPPEHYASPVAAGLALIFLVLESARQRPLNLGTRCSR